MGCNCNKRRLIERMEEVNGSTGGKTVKLNIFSRVLQFVGTVLFKILTIILFVVSLVGIAVYVIFCMITGKEPIVNLRKLTHLKEKSFDKLTSERENKIIKNAVINRKNKVGDRNHSWYAEMKNKME